MKILLIESKEETEKEPSQDSQHPAQHNDPVQQNVQNAFNLQCKKYGTVRILI